MKHHFESALAPRGIDIENGIVKGATLCTAGITAKGHSLETDGVLLAQLLASAKSKGVIPVGLDHRSGVKGAAGTAKNFRISGNKLLADIEFFKSHPDFALVMDQLAELGGTMGLSCSFTGQSENGRARCEDLLSADLTLHPAACPTGLFSSKYDDDETEINPMNDNDENEPMSAEEMLDAILSNQDDLLERLDAVEERQQAILEALDALEDDDDDESDDDDADDDQDAVLDERGARGGPHDYSDGLVPLEFAQPEATNILTEDGRRLSPIGAAMQTTEFSEKVRALELGGLSKQAALSRAVKDLARTNYGPINNL
jgi:hypothetical protein